MVAQHRIPQTVEWKCARTQITNAIQYILGCQISQGIRLQIELDLQIQNHTVQIHRAKQTQSTTIAEDTLHKHIAIGNHCIDEAIDRLRILSAADRKNCGPLNTL